MFEPMRNIGRIVHARAPTRFPEDQDAALGVALTNKGISHVTTSRVATSRIFPDFIGTLPNAVRPVDLVQAELFQGRMPIRQSLEPVYVVDAFAQTGPRIDSM